MVHVGRIVLHHSCRCVIRKLINPCHVHVLHANRGGDEGARADGSSWNGDAFGFHELLNALHLGDLHGLFDLGFREILLGEVVNFFCVLIALGKDGEDILSPREVGPDRVRQVVRKSYPLVFAGLRCGGVTHVAVELRVDFLEGEAGGVFVFCHSAELCDLVLVVFGVGRADHLSNRVLLDA